MKPSGLELYNVHSILSFIIEFHSNTKNKAVWAIFHLYEEMILFIVTNNKSTYIIHNNTFYLQWSDHMKWHCYAQLYIIMMMMIIIII